MTLTDERMGAPGALMRSEIAEQPMRWLDLFDTQIGVAQAAALLRKHRVSQVVLAARGTSDHAAIYGQYLLQAKLGMPAHLATPSMVTVFNRNVTLPSTAVVLLSQSGRSPDLLATMSSARRGGALTVSITNDPSSPMALGADVHIPICAGPERSVAATKSYTGELLALYLLVQEMRLTPREEVTERLAHLTRAGRLVHERFTAIAPQLAETIRHADRALILGRGYSLATAREAALKLIETCSLSASGLSAADAKHGPLAQVQQGTPVFCLLGADLGRDSIEALVPDLRARGGEVWSISKRNASNESTERNGRDLRVLEDLDDELIPMLEVIPFQLIALELSLARGLDPDRPVGLTKVTLTS